MKKKKDNNDMFIKTPIFELKQLTYTTIDKEFEYWLDVINKTYGEFGEISYEYIEDKKTIEEITRETLIQNTSNLVIENKKKDIMIMNLAQQINQLNIKVNQLEVK